MQLELLISIAILVMSVVIHEVAHGVMANRLGDPTARLQGRLTLNPIKHIDPFGSVLLPIILVVTNAPFLFGWAKPVPYNPYNLQRGGRFAESLVAGAGPATNLLLAVIFAIIVRFGTDVGLSIGAVQIAFSAVVINVMLMLFNMLPIPPLDGSKVLDAFLPRSLQMQYDRLRGMLEMNPFLGFGIVILFVLAFGSVFGSFVYSFARLLVGV